MGASGEDDQNTESSYLGRFSDSAFIGVKIRPVVSANDTTIGNVGPLEEGTGKRHRTNPCRR